MKTSISLIAVCILVTLWANSCSAQNPCSAGKMWSNYQEMRRANCKNCDRYFHCRGNYEAVKNCGGILQETTAAAISNLREWYQGSSSPDSVEDQKANRFGRSGGNCGNEYLSKVNCKYNPTTKKCG